MPAAETYTAAAVSSLAYLLSNALASSYLDVPVRSNLAAIGEVGLTGELRSVQNIGQRLSEVQRLGFHQCVVPYQKTDKLVGMQGMQLIRVKNVGQALQTVLGK